MTTPHALATAIRQGLHRVGEIEFEAINSSECFKLCHHEDLTTSREADHGGLAVYHGAGEARGISLYSESGEYRFLKGQLNLRRGWVLRVEGIDELRLALDLFYPAAVGMWLAHQSGQLEVEHLRDKLARQTGMYSRAKNISDAGAQALVPATCAAAVPCARRILWQISADTPLVPSEASHRSGIIGHHDLSEVIPLLCAAPCNHFVAECREASKQEYLASQAAQAAQAAKDQGAG